MLCRSGYRTEYEMKSIKERANAKINLYLDVLSIREDGFHDVKTVMHSVTFGDDITVGIEPSDTTSVRMTLDGSRFLPTDSRNLAVRAAELFLARAKLTATVDIHMVKRIPIAAGLAGGSSDAAAVLRALNKLCGKLFSIPALNDIASELGSDVVYCLYGKCALCEGRGEIITKVKTDVSAHVVIAIGNEHVSTPQAYKSLDTVFSNFDGSVKTGGDEKFGLLINSLKDNCLDINGIFNCFETAVLPNCPAATDIKKRMLELGASASMMSGSGPSVFGIFTNQSGAKNAALELRKSGYRAYWCELVR